MVIMARTRVMVLVVPEDSRMVKVTDVPAGPRMWDTASVTLVIVCPSIDTIISPDCNPAFCAGEPSIGATITTFPFFDPTVVPIPP